MMARIAWGGDHADRLTGCLPYKATTWINS